MCQFLFTFDISETTFLERILCWVNELLLNFFKPISCYFLSMIYIHIYIKFNFVFSFTFDSVKGIHIYIDQQGHSFRLQYFMLKVFLFRCLDVFRWKSPSLPWSINLVCSQNNNYSNNFPVLGKAVQ